MGRHDGYSPHKDLRRSHRSRSTVYKSLGENKMGLNMLVDMANATRERELRAVLRSDGSRYPTRSQSKFVVPGEESTEDELLEEEEEVVGKRTRTRSLRSSHLYDDGDDEASREPPVKSPPPRGSSHPKRRRVMMDSDEEELGSSHTTEANCKEEAEEGGDMYEAVKRRHTKMPSADKSPIVDNAQSSRSLRHERRQKVEEVKEDEREGEEEEEEEEEPTEPRQYPLRRERKAVQRYSDVVQQSAKSARNLRALERIERKKQRRLHQREFRRRMARSDSSSTGGSDSEAGGGKTTNRGRGGDVEERFERRKERSMAKARGRFLPINMTERDLGTAQSTIRERLRQAGASCSDIDPMTIDGTVFFDQVGGLGPHLQTLKEVVLFPMLYPDVFTRFNINPPKGVVFYGPPGTGKTLVARALANECGRGAKKVAFFMRKGADCLSKWVGESERQLRLLFDQAYAMRPSIIFFDEIDGLAPVRSSRQDQIHSSIVSTLLALMDGLDSRGEVVVIGATNRLDTLDPALRRPGRFDRELKFSLPDSAARREILQIHTKSWQSCTPSPSTLDWLADSTSGYCGADLKFLCTEAALIALRERYPHIYMSAERLVLDPNQLTIDRHHLESAMRRLTPASRRDLSIPSRPLEERTAILLSRALDDVLENRIPKGYRYSSSVSRSCGASELEKVVKALESPPVVPAVRLLLTGNPLVSDSGQSSFLLPSILARLDHLPIFSLAVGKLFADGRPEESLAQTMQAALRAAASTPAILLLPNVDQWYEVVPPSVAHMLAAALENLTGFTSLLFLATCDGELKHGTSAIRSIFRQTNVYEVGLPTREERTAYFDHIIQQALVPPKRFDPSAYVAPPVAHKEDVAPRTLSDREAKELAKVYEGQLRQFRIFLRDMLARLMRDRRFHIFNNPVDVADAEDYYEIIEQPMCMTDMMEKIDKKHYTHPDQFLQDIYLIMSNALEYNPAKDAEGKQIRHNAVALRDMADALFDMELDEKFVEKMEDSAKLLKEAGMVLEVEELPFGKTPQTAKSHGRITLRQAPIPEVDEEEEEESGEEGEGGAGPSLRTPAAARRRKRRLGQYSFGSSSKKKSSKSIVKKYLQRARSAHSTERRGDGEEHEEKNSESPDDSSKERASDEGTTTTTTTSAERGRGKRGEEGTGRRTSGTSHPEDLSADRESAQSGTPDKSPASGGGEKGEEEAKRREEVFTIDEEELREFAKMATKTTKGWPVPELERLAAALLHEIDSLKDCLDRSELPYRMERIVHKWEYTAQ